MGTVVMSLQEIKRYRLAMEVIEGKLSLKSFSELINLSYRQSQRIISKIRKQDVQGLAHGNKGRAPHNKTKSYLESEILCLLKTHYNGFNILHFQEKLLQDHRIKIKKDVLYRIAKTHGLNKGYRKRAKRSFKLRPRMSKEGMLIQFDGSKHTWFGRVKSDLLIAIDDATGKIVNGEFFNGETSFNAMKVIKELIEENGIPEAFYMDRASIYGKIDRDWESQIQRAFEAINIRLYLASTPQAKGRVERLFRTLQDRLIAEMKNANITTLEEANLYLKKEFVPRFNRQFSVKAEDDEKAYRKNVFGDLNMVFCKKVQRKIANGNGFSWDNVTWVLEEKNCYANRIVNINTHLNGSYSFDIMGRRVNARVYLKKRTYGPKHKRLAG